MKSSPLLLLFDIDGTLVGSRDGIGRHAIEDAVLALTGKRIDLPLAACGGRTDPDILDTAIELAGIPPDPKLCDALLDRYLQRIGEVYSPENGAFAYPGVASLLETLGERRDINLGLVTGNVLNGARIKLETFDLWRWFPVGAFGSDSRVRPELPPIAIRRAEGRAGEKFYRSSIFVIGDTAADVQAGKLNGLRTIGLGTHPAFLPELRAAGPEFFLDNLDDAGGFLAAIEAGR